jgi:hypothetical protein
MSPDRRPPDRLRAATAPARERAKTTARVLDARDIAPWVIASVRAWPRSVDDRLVADAVGVWPQHVRTARKAQR